MRFDDGLDTVLGAAIAGPGGVQSLWRQAVDLIGRRRSGPREAAIARLRAIRDDVPLAVRIASARGLERANPPAGLVALFADDAPEVAGPVVRSARLTTEEWVTLLPTMHPVTRGVLRHRRDLSDGVRGALAGFGTHDLALPAGDLTEALIEPAPVAVPLPPAETVAEPEPDQPPFEEANLPAPVTEQPAIADDPAPDQPPPFVAPEPTPFVAVADVARTLPVVAEALRREREAPVAEPAPPPAPPARADLEIAGILARLEAHRDRVPPAPVAPRADAPAVPRFHFETDADGVIRWCEGVERGPVVGLSLAGRAAVADAAATGAIRRRTRFVDSQLRVPGESDAGGAWRISGVPIFERASGRFTGYRGIARRPRPDEEPRSAPAVPGADTLRQLVHELRTPTNAIAGFAEMIAREMLGPVPPSYREHAAAIGAQASGLIDAIDDVDTAARLESRTLDQRPDATPLQPLLSRVVTQLHPLADLRGAMLVIDLAPDLVVAGDPQLLDRLFSRLLTALVAAADRGETVAGAVVRDGDRIAMRLGRPRALSIGEGPLFSADAEVEAAAPGAPLLGGGFAFRLARRLAAELGGGIAIMADHLTLHLPAAVDDRVEQVTV